MDICTDQSYATSKIEKANSDIDIYIIPIGTVKEALVLATALRNEDHRVEVELSGRKLRKAMEKANRESIKNTIVLGGNEVVGNNRIKDMHSGEEEVFSFLFGEK